METKRFVLDDTFVQLEAAGLQTLAAARMAGIENRHIVFLSHLVNSREEAQEILFGIDILLAVSR